MDHALSYHFPLVRVYTKLCLFLLTDLVSSAVLWLTDKNKAHFEHGVTRFSIQTSVFDLAILSICKVAVLIGLYGILEKLTYKLASESAREKTKQIRSSLVLLLFLISAGNLTYVIIKDVYVLHAYNKDPKVMTHTYYALCISSLCFGSVEILLYFWYLRYLNGQRNIYARLHVGGDGQSDQQGKESKKPVDVRRLMILAKPEGWLIFYGTLGLVGSTASQILAPLYFGRVVNAATFKSMSELNKQVVILFLIYTFGSIAAFFRAWLYTLAGQRLVSRLRKTIFEHLLYQEVAFFDTNRTGELMNRLASDSEVIQNALSVNVSMLLRYLAQIIGSLVVMFIVNPKLTGVLVAVVPIVGVAAQKYGAYVRDQQKIFQDELGKSASTAEETLSSIRTVRSFAQEPKSVQLYSNDINKSYKAGQRLSLASGVFNMGTGIIAQGAIALVLWYGGKLVHEGDMNVGQLTSFILYALTIAMAFAFLSSVYGDFMRAVGASYRIFELLDRRPALTPGTEQLATAKVRLEFENVEFSYPTRPDTNVLRGISFSINPGETVALVGPSGGGKSTVISLIERFYDPSNGRILMGERPLYTLNPDWFRKRIGIVSQEPVLFATTIGENISYGREASQSEIEEAARQANAHDFITSFQDGYETTVGERGIKLSGGQKQRVAIARALLMDPDILLLDEATSALDAESEFLVQEAIDRAMVGRTVLVIAHRLSTVRNAHKVIVIDQGRIAEEGTHEHLISLDGVYKKLVLRQLQAGNNDLAHV